jgi:hypothetical protein
VLGFTLIKLSTRISRANNSAAHNKNKRNKFGLVTLTVPMKTVAFYKKTLAAVHPLYRLSFPRNAIGELS